MICKNCGRILKTKDKCQCTSIPAPDQSSPNTDEAIFPAELFEDNLTELNKSVVMTDYRQLTQLNAGQKLYNPVRKPPFDLLVSSAKEIAHWAEKTIEWHYDFSKAYRLTYGGLVEYASLCIGNPYSAQGKSKLEKVKLVVKRFTEKNHNSDNIETNEDFYADLY